MRIPRVALLVAVILWSGSAFGQGDLQPLRDYVEYCRASVSTSGAANSFNNGMCVGYLSAIFDFESAVSRNASTFCIPDKVALGDIAKIVVKYGDDHPEELHTEWRRAIIKILTKAYPCDKTR